MRYGDKAQLWVQILAPSFRKSTDPLTLGSLATWGQYYVVHRMPGGLNEELWAREVGGQQEHEHEPQTGRKYL